MVSVLFVLLRTFAGVATHRCNWSTPVDIAAVAPIPRMWSGSEHELVAAYVCSRLTAAVVRPGSADTSIRLSFARVYVDSFPRSCGPRLSRIQPTTTSAPNTKIGNRNFQSSIARRPWSCPTHSSASRLVIVLDLSRQVGHRRVWRLAVIQPDGRRTRRTGGRGAWLSRGNW